MVNEPNLHHLVLGQIEDFLTGSVILDTHDERYHQKIAKTLVLKGGFNKKEIKSKYKLEIAANKKKALIKIDFLVNVQGKTAMLIRYAPGSLVTRRLSTLALSRITKPFQIPLVVVTNGEDAEIINGDTGKLIAKGFENIPCRDFIIKKMKFFSFKKIDTAKYDQASKIAFACEIDGACPCDSDICIIE